jgi:hypothetical protein
MKYKLLSNGRGVPMTLTPENACPLRLTFEGAPERASVYVKMRGGNVFYREIIGGEAAIDLSPLAGDVEIGVISTSPPGTSRWACGYLTVWRHISGVSCVPNAQDLAEQVRSLMLENEKIKRENASLTERLDKLEKEFEEFYKGYDFI